MSLLKDFYQTTHEESTGDHSLGATLELNASHPIFGGHFPGQPIVPGVCMVQMVKEALEKRLGRPARLTASRNIKFLHVINPLQHGTVALHLDFREGPTGRYAVDSRIASPDGQTVFFKMRGTFEAR